MVYELTQDENIVKKVIVKEIFIDIQRLENEIADLHKKILEIPFKTKPDQETFPCLAYAYEALKKGGTMPCVMNAANEVAVEAFLAGKIKFLDIPKVVREAMDAHKTIPHPSLQDLLRLDEETREKLKKC